METSPVPPKDQRLTSEEENALVCQVLEIIGGITLESLQTLDRADERTLCLLEEGDDSVFYSDEDQTNQECELANTSCEFDANEGKYLISSEGVEKTIPHKKGDPEGEDLAGKENLVMETETAMQFILTEEEEECKQFQTQKPEYRHRPDSADAGEEADRTPENFMFSSCGESQQEKCTDEDLTMQTEQKESPATANEHEKEQLVQEAQTSNLEPNDATNEECHARLNRKEEVPEDMLNVEHQISGDGHIMLEHEPEREDNFHFPVGFHQGPSPGYATLPLLRKSRDSASGHEKSFDHVSSSKYSTVSYRRIRRGNTRQKIEEFEYMIMNL